MKFIKYIPILMLVVICTSQRCSLEDEIRLDSDFVKVESRLDGKMLLRNKSEYALYVVGVSNEFDSQLAIDTATARGRGSLAKQVRENVARLTSDYLTRVNCDSNNELFAAVVDSVADSIYNLALYKSEVELVREDKASDPHTFFVVIKFDFNIINIKTKSIFLNSI